MEPAPGRVRCVRSRGDPADAPRHPGTPDLLGVPNPFYHDHTLTFFLQMLPYILVILVLIAVSGEAMRKRIGAPAALGIPYVRGERGH